MGRETFGKPERWTLSESTCTCAFRELPVQEKYIYIYKTVYQSSKGSGVAGKSERIKTQGGLVGIYYGMSKFVRRPRFRFRTLSFEPTPPDPTCQEIATTAEHDTESNAIPPWA
ncbi:hypothetical protein M9H77_21117 [Catharanthus roseus]|uniref:Uncharacterized protein n=1 Tax=Catharanthus roseus TaxID=4058 RepID=A0ACC0ALV0_CATRO|nr:hypothetical protein M9H77_21117 [Catharanthus roseus]